MLILDEPTSGVDPLARDRFWELLIDLSRNQGVTIFVSTHFMNEAERCDRISLMDSGRVLATDTPADSSRHAASATLEDAFISYLEAASGRARRRRSRIRFRPSTGDRRGAASYRATAARIQLAAAVRLYDSRDDRASCATRSGWASPCSAPRC